MIFVYDMICIYDIYIFVSSQENIPVKQLLNLNTTAMDLTSLTSLYNKTALLTLEVVFIAEII